jgi:hypothetical protein
MSTDQRKERRSVEERIEYLVTEIWGTDLSRHESRKLYKIREALIAQFHEALADQREMSVEAINALSKYDDAHMAGLGMRLTKSATVEAILAAKLEDEC